jgi:methyltransferase (TIGR00027 family)
MEEGRPSTTAIITATWRAAHLLVDGEPKILEDSLALRLSGTNDEATFRTHYEALLAEFSRRLSPELAHALFRSMRAIVTMRSRYVEDELRNALERGVTQYVILGAGLDSFAYRRRDVADKVQVFEVDHPASQQWKRERLRELQVPLPPNLTFLPLDFERQPLIAGLRAGGYRLEAPGFFSWLGVIPFLTEEAIFGTLKEVASLGAGTEIVFDYLLVEALLDEESRRIVAVGKEMSAARGEPWLSFFEPMDLAAQVKRLGFTQVWDFGAEEANLRYFAGRTDGLRIPNAEGLLKARVSDVV